MLWRKASTIGAGDVNGTSCHYRHCLPPEFVFKKTLGKEEKEIELTIEERIDAERQNLFASEAK
jgi:hypothetical protein